jgi:hypothetical protein
MQAPCPHCNELLSHDYVDSAMDELYHHRNELGYSMNRECEKCYVPIKFLNNASMYYIVHPNGEQNLIGGQ